MQVDWCAPLLEQICLATKDHNMNWSSFMNTKDAVVMIIKQWPNNTGDEYCIVNFCQTIQIAQKILQALNKMIK